MFRVAPVRCLRTAVLEYRPRTVLRMLGLIQTLLFVGGGGLITAGKDQPNEKNKETIARRNRPQFRARGFFCALPHLAAIVCSFTQAHTVFLFSSVFRIWMHCSVHSRRHPASRYESAHGFQFVTLLPCRICFPLGEIQFFPAFAHMPPDPPGERRNTAVPRPVRAIGVAVPTRPHQDLFRL